MDYKKINANSYNIHIVKNKDFHTVEFCVVFTENVTKEKITYRNALIDILTYATLNYDTKDKLIKKCQDLYSLRPIVSSHRNGNVLITKFGISTIDSKYIEKGNLVENILLLKEIILNPLVSNKSFSSKYFSIIKKNLESETKTIVEEPRLYASLKLLDLLDDNHEQLLSGYSDLSILDKMNEHTLYQSYLDLINNSKIDIYISGDINNSDKLVKVIKDNFIFSTRIVNINSNTQIYYQKRNPYIVSEQGKCQQSKLSIGYKLYDLTNIENRYVSFVFNNIFGGCANSILSRLVRQEHSLCYYIGSFINRLDNVLIINSGILKENYQKVLNLIKEAKNDMEMGKFTVKDLEMAKMEVLFELSNIFENNRSIIDYYHAKEIFKSDDIDKRIEMIKNVSKNDVIAFSKKINLDAIFFLEGDL